MSSQPVGDYGFAIQELLNYLKNKGQIWSAAQMASIKLVGSYVKRRYGIDLGLDNFVDDWLQMSIIEAARWDTVAQRNVEKVAKLSTQVNYVEEQGSRTRILPALGRRKNNK